MPLPFPNSIRARYLALVAVLCLILIAVGVWGHQALQDASTRSTTQLQARQEVRKTALQVRVALFDGYQALNQFLLDPARTESRQRMLASLNRAIIDSDRLLSAPWIADNGQQQAARALKLALVSLGTDISQLVDARVDPDRQYPSMAISAKVMQPNRDRFVQAIATAITETREDSNDHDTRLAELFDIRQRWSDMTSTYRMYLANRMGSFDERSLPTQAAMVTTYHDVLDEQLSRLQNLAQKDALGLQTTLAVEDMQAALAGWYDGFLQARAIHRSYDWRADAKLIKTRVEPRLNKITTLLGDVEQAITDAAASDITRLSESTRTLTRLTWLLGGIGLAFVLLIVLSLDQFVFRPIRLVADALKGEAFGNHESPLPAVSYQEAQDLVDAFSEMRKQVHHRQAALVHEATHDALTGLPNRTLLQDRMSQAIGAARRDQRPVTFLVMDLDRFKDVNDTLGHIVGDQLLTEIGNRLRDTLREADTIARMGGDEYGVLLLNTRRESAPQVAQKIQDILAEPFLIHELRLYIGASIGIACYPEDGVDYHALIQRADVALYIAKDKQQRYALYESAQDNYSVGRLALMGDLRGALANDSLSLHFQPKLDVATRKPTGVEALLRWSHPDYGPIPPDQTVALAEHTGLIGALTYWVLDQALTIAARWHHNNTPLNLAINLSVHNLRDRKFPQQVRDCLASHRFPPEALTLEITEHAMMSNRSDAIEVLKELDVMGVRLSVDDYGTGFSSLAYLKQLPVDELKIDKSFVMRMHHNPNDEVIVRSTIDLAHNLGLNVVAEGVESGECLDRLAAFGCDIAQGFHMSAPLPENDLQAWIDAHR